MVVVALLMIVFGLAEVAAGFSGNFMGVISATRTTTYTLASVSIGAFYSIAGLMVLTMKRWGAILAIALLGADVLGRIGMVATGLYPFNGVDAASIVAGTAIAAIFAFFIGLRLGKFT